MSGGDTTTYVVIGFFLGLLLVMPIVGGIARMLGLYTIVEERRCHVYVLFGKVLAIIDEPGLHLLWPRLGLVAGLVGWMGKCYKVDLGWIRSTCGVSR